MFQAAIAVATSPRTQRFPELAEDDEPEHYDHQGNPYERDPRGFETDYDRGDHGHRHEEEHYGSQRDSRLDYPPADDSRGSSGYTSPATRVSRAAERTPLGYVPVRTGDDYFTSTLEQHPIRTPSPADMQPPARQRRHEHEPAYEAARQAWPPMEIETSPRSSAGQSGLPGSSRPRYEEAPIPAGVEYPDVPLSRGVTPTGRRRTGSSPRSSVEVARRSRITSGGRSSGTRVIVASPAALASPISLFNDH